MTAALAAGNIILGLVYTGYGTMTLMEMIRDKQTGWASRISARPGSRWPSPAARTTGSTACLRRSRAAPGLLDLVAVLIGFPAGVIWFLLRVEAFSGGRGDRFVPGSPLWIWRCRPSRHVRDRASPPRWRRRLTTSTQTSCRSCSRTCCWSGSTARSPTSWPAPRSPTASRSAAGRSPASRWRSSLRPAPLMHGVYALSALGCFYGPDIHGIGIDWISVPAAAYFPLGRLRALNRGTFPGLERRARDACRPRARLPRPAVAWVAKRPRG